MVIATSCITPGIGFQDTHLNVRMELLTLIIIGEGVISVTRLVNKTVQPGGWTKWSFVHILGVTTNVVRPPLITHGTLLLLEFANVGILVFYLAGVF